MRISNKRKKSRKETPIYQSQTRLEKLLDPGPGIQVTLFLESEVFVPRQGPRLGVRDFVLLLCSVAFFLDLKSPRLDCLGSRYPTELTLRLLQHERNSGGLDPQALEASHTHLNNNPCHVVESLTQNMSRSSGG